MTSQANTFTVLSNLSSYYLNIVTPWYRQVQLIR